jgi:predicted DNA-binding transcriptional regulator AlpA
MSYDLKSLRRAAEALPPQGSLILPREALLEALGPEAPPAAGNGAPDRLLTAKEAATLLGVSTKYIYAHADEFPFKRRLGKKTLRFSAQGIERFLAKTR